jgi:hypothetical protein
MPFLLEGVIAWRGSYNRNGSGFEFKRLFGSRTFHELSYNGQRRRNPEMAYFLKIRKRIIKYDLQIFEIGTIIEFNEAKRFTFTNGSYSSVDDKRFSEEVSRRFVYLGNSSGHQKGKG